MSKKHQITFNVSTASINLFDGEELLPFQLENLRPVIDHISVVYQLKSDTGNNADSNIENLLMI